jgi:hypothetical protein
MSLLSLLPDSLRRTADMAVIFIMEHPQVFGEFIEASLAQEYPLSMRASRVVHLCAIEQPSLIRPYLRSIIEVMPVLHDQSVARNFLYLFDQFIDELSEEDVGRLLSFCYASIEDLSKTNAVRTLSLKLLYVISQRFPEIKPELVSIIHYNLPECTPAFEAQSRQIIKKLEKEIITGR